MKPDVGLSQVRTEIGKSNLFQGLVLSLLAEKVRKNKIRFCTPLMWQGPNFYSKFFSTGSFEIIFLGMAKFKTTGVKEFVTSNFLTINLRPDF